MASPELIKIVENPELGYLSGAEHGYYADFPIPAEIKQFACSGGAEFAASIGQSICSIYIEIICDGNLVVRRGPP